MMRKIRISLIQMTLFLIVAFSFMLTIPNVSAENLDKDNKNFELQNLIFPVYESNYTGNTEKSVQKPKKKKIVVKNDTLSQNKIVKIYPAGTDQYTVEIELKEKNQLINIYIFNMLGKKVIDVHNGPASGTEYNIDASRLPNGVYICILEGGNFKHAKKFIVSR